MSPRIRLAWLIDRLTNDLPVRTDHDEHDEMFRQLVCCGDVVCVKCQAHLIAEDRDRKRWEHVVLPPHVSWSPFCLPERVA